MSSSFEQHRPGRLRGRRVFLSASVPVPERAARYRRVADAHLEIEEAVVSLARAVFTEGGTLVFGGHPAISPLVAVVAGEYITPRDVGAIAPQMGVAAESNTPGVVEQAGNRGVPGGKPVLSTLIWIYQSRAYEGHVPDETTLMFRAGYAELRWTNAVNGERYDERRRGQPQCTESLRHMRERMIEETAPAAMVCIGGMEGVEQEVEIFQQRGRGAPIYVFGETGGAAALMAERSPGGASSLRVIDREVLARLAPLRHSRERGQETALLRSEQRSPPRRAQEGSPVPYPLIAQLLVAELAQDSG